MPEISIIILTKNAGEKFRDILKQIFCQKIEKELEVIVIDSGSTDKTIEIARHFSAIKILEIKPEDFDHARTRNLGAGLTQGKYLVFLTQDALPFNEYWLKELIKPLETDEKIAGVFSRQIAYPKANLFEKYFLNFRYPAQEVTKNGRIFSKPLSVEEVFFSNVSSAIRKEIWQNFQFPENLIMSEDQGWAKNVLRAGYRLFYNPQSIVYHSHCYNLIQNFQRFFSSGASLTQLKLHHFNRHFNEFFKYFSGQINFIIKKRGLFFFLFNLPFQILYNLSQIFGFLLGRHYKIFPIRWRKKMSLHKKNLE